MKRIITVLLIIGMSSTISANESFKERLKKRIKKNRIEFESKHRQQILQLKNLNLSKNL